MLKPHMVVLFNQNILHGELLSPRPPHHRFRHCDPLFIRQRDSQREGFPWPHAINTHEGVIQLTSDAGDHAWWAQWLARAAPTHAEGARHARGVGQALSGSWRCYTETRFDGGTVAVGSQVAWLEYRACDFTRGGEVTPTGEEVLREEEALFADLLLKIKRMLVAAR